VQFASSVPAGKVSNWGWVRSHAIRYVSYRQTLSVSVKKPTRKWHIWFFPTHEPTLKKPKEPFFANARQDDKTIKSKFEN